MSMLFRAFDRTMAEEILPEMFDILYANMSRIAPTGGSYEDDRRMWMSYMTSAGEEQKVILMYDGAVLAGYFQYRIDGDTLLVEEIEIAPDHQRTLLFYYFFRYALRHIPSHVIHVEAYIDKANMGSQRIAEKLGMKIIGENPSGRSWRCRGEAGRFRALVPGRPDKERSDTTGVNRS